MTPHRQPPRGSASTAHTALIVGVILVVATGLERHDRPRDVPSILPWTAIEHSPAAGRSVPPIRRSASMTATHGTTVLADPSQVPAVHQWAWPTRTRTVLRPWEAPANDYAAGHRGIDLAAPVGSDVTAVDAGMVTFAGQVAGRTVVTVQHGGGVLSSYDRVSPRVVSGDVVERGAQLGTAIAGHCGAATPCVHLGVRIGTRYVDPLSFLPAPSWPILLPAPH